MSHVSSPSHFHILEYALKKKKNTHYNNNNKKHSVPNST